LDAYADVAQETSKRLRDVARRLGVAMDSFSASCTALGSVVDPALAEKLRRYLDDVAPYDERVRRVARAFERADRALSGSGPSGPTGRPPPRRTRDGVVGGGAVKRQSPIDGSPDPPDDDGPDLPVSVPPPPDIGEFWTQEGVEGTFRLVETNGRVQVVRGETWICRADGPAAGTSGVPSGAGAGLPESAYHLEATWLGDALDGEIQVCWYGGDDPPTWTPAPVHLSRFDDGKRLTGTWDDIVHGTEGDVTLHRVGSLAPEDFGLPATNLRIYEFGVKKAYRIDGSAASVDESYTADPTTDELVARHQGIDFSSRDPHWLFTSLPFSTPVAGTIHLYPESPWNTIGLRLETGDWLQFLHASEVGVSEGQRVERGSPLGRTGATGAATVHLHVQAKSASGDCLNPDLTVEAGRGAPPTNR
jgi:hypothetical protein